MGTNGCSWPACDRKDDGHSSTEQTGQFMLCATKMSRWANQRRQSRHLACVVTKCRPISSTSVLHTLHVPDFSPRPTTLPPALDRSFVRSRGRECGRTITRGRCKLGELRGRCRYTDADGDRRRDGDRDADVRRRRRDRDGDREPDCRAGEGDREADGEADLRLVERRWRDKDRRFRRPRSPGCLDRSGTTGPVSKPRTGPPAPKLVVSDALIEAPAPKFVVSDALICLRVSTPHPFRSNNCRSLSSARILRGKKNTSASQRHTSASQGHTSASQRHTSASQGHTLARPQVRNGGWDHRPREYVCYEARTFWLS